jgi:hypothetical protein
MEPGRIIWKKCLPERDFSHWMRNQLKIFSKFNTLRRARSYPPPHTGSNIWHPHALINKFWRIKSFMAVLPLSISKQVYCWLQCIFIPLCCVINNKMATCLLWESPYLLVAGLLASGQYVSGRFWDRPLRHSFSWFSSVFNNFWDRSQVPRCYCMLFKQPSRFVLIEVKHPLFWSPSTYSS